MGDKPRDPALEPVPAVPSATIVLMRDAPEGLEVLLLRRSRSAGFVPGAYVFPGGHVDPSDAEPAGLALVDGLTAQAAASRLDLTDADPPAIAYYRAASREAFEETGILVGLTADGSAPTTAAKDQGVDRLRDELMEDRIDFGDVLLRMDCRVAGGAMEYLAHWITPESEPRRFDTRFFAAKVPIGTEPIVDQREMTRAVWITPARALRENAEDRLPMILPTIRTLDQLAKYASAEEALRALALESVPTILPTLVVTPSDIGLRPTVDD